MPLSSYNVTKNVNKRITASAAGGVVTIIDNAVEPGLGIVLVNTFVDNLKIYAAMGSLPAVESPVFALEDSESEKLFKTHSIEWGSPRKQLDILISGDGITWNLIGSVSLLNSSGFPYRMHNLLDFFTDGLGARLGNDFKIGVQAKNVGYGLIESGDVVTVHGSYVQEYVVTDTNGNMGNSNQKSSSTVSSVVPSQISKITLIAANANRIGATIWNDSISILYVDFDDSVSLTSFARKLEPNGYLETPFGYTGSITGIWESVDGNAIIREFI